MQLAHQAGAHVIASVGSAARAEGLPELGADEVVSGLDGVAPVFGVLDNVGGSLLAQAFARLEPGGSPQSIGMASGEPSTLDLELARRRGPNSRIQAFNVGDRFSADLAVLVALLAAGRLDPNVGWRGDWTQVGEAIAALRSRQVLGKAVLDLTTGAQV